MRRSGQRCWRSCGLYNLSPKQLDAYINPAYKRALVDAGREEGKLELIEQILQCRLGEMPATGKERLHHCTLPQLNALVNPAVDATTWDEFLVALPNATP